MASSKADNQLLKSLEAPKGLTVPEGSAWGEAALRGDFRSALPTLESDMADSATAGKSGATSGDTSSLEKLWWVRAQLATEGMPLAALTTPLTEVVSEVKSSPNLFPTACSTFFLLGQHLALKKQTRLACSLLDHAIDFSSFLGRNERQALRDFTRGVYQSELERAESKKETASYVSRLKDKIKELEKIEVEGTPKPLAPPIKQDGTKTINLSAKAIREDALERDFREDPKEDFPASYPLPEKPKSQIPGFLMGAVCVALLMAAWQFGFSKRQDEESLKDETEIAKNLVSPAPNEPVKISSTPPVAVPVQNPPPATPAVFPSTAPTGSLPGAPAGAEPTEKAKTLDANLDSLGERLKNVTFKGMEKAKSIEELAKDPEVDTAAMNSKEAKSLAKPTPTPGDDELATLDGQKAAHTPTPDPKKVPLLDPNQLGQVATAEIGQTNNPRSLEPAARPNKDSIQPSLPDFSKAGRPGATGDVGGPPDPQGKGLDGNPVRSYPVDRFQQPEVYKTITDTNVLSAPSLLGQTIARLPTDTSIQVVSRVGQWLELRSLGGQRGFIYAQNAVPSSSAEKQDDHSADHLD